MNAATPSGFCTIPQPSTGVLTLVSQAWNLVRLNFKDCIRLNLWPALLFCLSSLVLSIPSSFPFLGGTSVSKLMLVIGCALLGLFIWLIAMGAWAFSFCALSRLFYSAIVDERPLPVGECWQHALKNWQPLVLTLFFLLLITAALFAIDLILLYVSIMFSAAVLDLLGITFFQNKHDLLMVGMGILFLITWGFAIISLLIVLFNAQGVMFTFPFIGIATRHREQAAWWPGIRQAFRLIYGNFSRLALFGTAFFLFACAVSGALHFPVLAWAGLEISRLGLPTRHAIPIHVQAIIDLWTFLTSFILLSFYSSAMTLMWHDCQIRKEGLDLKLWLHHLRQQNLKQHSTIGRSP